MSLAGRLSRRSASALSQASGSSTNIIAPKSFTPMPLSSSSSHYSTSSSSSSTSTVASKGAEKSAAGSVVRWDRYLSLRKQKRIAGLVTTIPTTFLAAAGAGSYFLTQEIDPSQAIMGIDPAYVFGLATIGCTGESSSEKGFPFFQFQVCLLHLSRRTRIFCRLRVPHRAHTRIFHLVHVPSPRHGSL